MLKILVADDEMLERRAIKTILRKVYGDKITILEAKNGRESIEISEAFKPDIFIMDIKMPGIDGIQSIKEIKNIHKNAYFIVLTAYDYFDFAKEALECGVKEYILKPLDRSEFLKIIGKAINLIDKKKNERKEELIRMEQMCSMRPMLENQLSYLIITNNLNNIEYVECMKYLHISFQLGYCLIIRLSEKYAYYKTNTYEKKIIKYKVSKFIKEIVRRNYKAIVNDTFGENIIIFVDNNIMDESYIRVDSIEFGRRLRKEVKKKFNISLKIGIGKQHKGINNLFKSYNEAYISLKYDALDVNVKHFQDISTVIDDDYVKSRLYSASKYLEKSEIEAAINMIHKNNIDNKNNIILQSVDFIKRNYHKEDITLDRVANRFNLSSYYFSRTFKEFMGINYSEYLTEIRIKKAKNMLNTSSMSIKEICFKVGYKDPNYFSRVFKKIEGISPTEYKNVVTII